MSFFQQLFGWFGFLKPPVTPERETMQAALERGRRAKLAEDYPRALSEFDRVIDLARQHGEQAMGAAATLHQGEILIRQGDYAAADTALNTLLDSARSRSDHAQTAYALCALGTLAQEQGDWTRARQHYEEALNIAKAARASGAEGRALGHLADTYLHDSNASYAVHLLRSAQPQLNAAGDMELTSYFAGLLGQALIQTGQEVEGDHWLRRALQIAGYLQYRYFQRYWALVLGERALAEARYHDAQEYYEKTLSLFPDDARTPQRVVTLCALAQTFLSLREPERALEHAEQAVHISDDMDAMTRALARGTLGTALRIARRSAEAIPHLEAAVAVYETVAPTERTAPYIEVLRNLAAAQASTGDNSAPDTYRRATTWAEQMDAELEVAQSRRDLGLLFFNQRDFVAAVQEWQAVIGLYEEKRQHAQVARLYTDIASARKQIGQHPRAMKDYEQALMTLNYVDETDYETRGLVLSNAANAYADRGDVESADAFFNDAISMAEKLGDTVAESVRRGNYGWFLLVIGRPRRAIAMLDEALALSRQHELALQTAVQTDNLGLAHDLLGEYEIALGHHRDALAQIKPLGLVGWQAAFQTNLAGTLIALGETGQAEPLLTDAITTARDRNDTDLLIRALTTRARLALLGDQPGAATDPLQEAILLARRIESRRLLAEALTVQSEQAAALNQPDAAQSHWDEAQRLYTMLRMPQAKLNPSWLHDHPQGS